MRSDGIGTEPNGAESNGTEWNRMKRNGTRLSLKRNRMELDGIE